MKHVPSYEKEFTSFDQVSHCASHGHNTFILGMIETFLPCCSFYLIDNNERSPSDPEKDASVSKRSQQGTVVLTL